MNELDGLGIYMVHHVNKGRNRLEVKTGYSYMSRVTNSLEFLSEGAESENRGASIVEMTKSVTSREYLRSRTVHIL